MTIKGYRCLKTSLLCFASFGLGVLGCSLMHDAPEVTPETNLEPITDPIEVVEIVEEKIPLPMIDEPEYILLEDVKLTAYCCEPWHHICNDGNPSVTATGTAPTPGRTVAVDPKVIPYGSEVIIDGHTYIAEDCGGSIKGNKIDICFETHQEAIEFGVRYAAGKVKVVDKDV